MKKILFLLLVSASILFAKKPYLIMVADSNCNVCVESLKMFSENKELKSTIENYTDFQLFSKANAIESGLIVHTTPTFFFFAKEKKTLLVQPLEGKPISAKEFTLYIKDIYNKYNQYQN